MASKGMRKYVCDDCRKHSFHHWIELNRASKVRCPSCGCGRMEMVSEDARKDVQRLQEVRLGNGTQSTTIPKPRNSHTLVT